MQGQGCSWALRLYLLNAAYACYLQGFQFVVGHVRVALPRLGGSFSPAVRQRRNT